LGLLETLWWTKETIVEASPTREEAVLVGAKGLLKRNSGRRFEEERGGQGNAMRAGP